MTLHLDYLIFYNNSVMNESNIDIIKNEVITIGIFAHANAGKTTLTEQILYHTNVITDIGRVDTGNTVSDSLKIEKERGISVKASLVTFNIDQKTIQLIDTPGHIDFSAEVERSINVLDGAILVISGVEGIEPQTYTIWKALQLRSIPIIFFINKMDRVGADYHQVLINLKLQLSKNIFPLIHIDRIKHDQLVIHSPKKDDLIELITNFDDSIFELYINNPELVSLDVVDRKITHLARKGLIYPVIGGSALKGNGIELLLRSINKYIPGFIKVSKEFSAIIYLVKWINKQKYLFAKVLSGRINNRDQIIINDDLTEKLKGLYKIEGAEIKACEQAEAGDIVLLSGINVQSGQYIGEQTTKVPLVKFVKPLLTMQIIPEKEDQLLELMEALKILNEEDPYLNVVTEKMTGNIFVNLIGEVQGQIIQNSLSERFGINVFLKNPIVVHKERPTIVGQGKATYTSVSAVELEISPLPEGSGLIYKSKLSTDFLQKKYQNQTERLILQYSKQGFFGWEVIDAEIALVGGRFDSMGSSPLHFNIAVPLALMRAFKKCNMQIVEPIFSYTLCIPKESLTMVIKSLSNKSSVFEIEKEEEDEITIKGTVPLSKVLNFPSELMKLTSGKGVFLSQLNNYEFAPNQPKNNNYFGPDPRNEVFFVINEMKGSMAALDMDYIKIKKTSRSKFKRLQEEKEKRRNH